MLHTNGISTIIVAGRLIQDKGLFINSGIFANVDACDAGLEYARDCVHSLHVYVCGCASL